MRTMRFSLLAALLTVGLATAPGALGVTDSMQPGKAEIRSAGAIAFGPEAVLFIGDGMGAAIYAIDTADRTPIAGATEVEDLSAKVAALLGTTADQILINDMAVNPLSRRAYLSVSRGRGPTAIPVIVRTAAGGRVEVLSLDNVRHAKAILPNAPNPDAIEAHGPGKGFPVRMEAITQIQYVNGQILIAGLSNEEFASNLRTIPFPFTSIPRGTAIEIYHGQHGTFETHAPVRTFTTYRIGNEDVILASYACTPLVVFRNSELAKGGKVMGKTIAELGSSNTPIDMLVYRKAGQNYILLSSTDRGLMKIPADNLERYEAITTPIPDTAGVPFSTVDLSGVTQVARLDDSTALMLMAGANGRQSLKALPLP
jgi:hypothetical protein